MHIIIACSGAGGHLSAGLSIAEGLKNGYKDLKIFFLSSDYKIAKSLTEGAGYSYYKVYSKGLLNRNPLGITKFLIGQFIGFFQSCFLLTRIKPGLVVGTGGFATVGIICWSRLFGIPVVIHEQNIILGRANRFLSPLANKILLSFDGSKQYFTKSRSKVTGMPVRFKNKMNKIDALNKLGLEQDRFTILVMGGSSGAHSINQLIIDILPKLSNYKDKMQFIHLTGFKDYENIREVYRQYEFKVYVEAFSLEMEVVYSSADLVISRAGSSSISEIAFFGLPCIVIPYRYSEDKHQFKNAEILLEKGAAILLPEKEASSDKLMEIVNRLMNQPETLKNMTEKSQSLSNPDVVNRITEEIGEFINV